MKVCTEYLDSAIDSLCPEIWNNMYPVSEVEHSEEKLWEELVCCVLSSQVKYELSQVVTQHLKCNGFLGFEEVDNTYEEQLVESLKSPVVVDGRPIKYRFPNIKAKQISDARYNLYVNGSGINEILDKYPDSLELRLALVKLVPGLGMKQASMYLRNISNSYELAVIDSHVLNYMNMMNLVKKIPSSISIAQYLEKEMILTEYAEKFGFPVGCVDYAIWIVMRVAKKDGYL